MTALDLARRIVATDVDAISLSMANLAGNDPSRVIPAARTVLIAVITNTLVKAGMAVSMGAPELRKRMLPMCANLPLNRAITILGGDMTLGVLPGDTIPIQKAESGHVPAKRQSRPKRDRFPSRHA